MKIETIKKRFSDEWLLIRVTSTDEKDQPLEGDVLLHSKSRDEIYEAQKTLDDDLYITYSSGLPKKGFAVAFHG